MTRGRWRAASRARVLPSDYTDGKVMDWNFTLEKEVMAEHGRAHRLRRQSRIQPTDVCGLQRFHSRLHLVCHQERRPCRPANSRAWPPGLTIRRCTGPSTLFSSIGWSNHTSFQFELERRYHKGMAFQVFYRVAKTLLTNRDTDGTQSGETIHSSNYYLPGAVPTDLHDLTSS